MFDHIAKPISLKSLKTVLQKVHAHINHKATDRSNRTPSSTNSIDDHKYVSSSLESTLQGNGTESLSSIPSPESFSDLATVVSLSPSEERVADKLATISEEIELSKVYVLET